MAHRDYIPVSETISELFGKLAGWLKPPVLVPQLAGGNLAFMPDPGSESSCETSCTGTCSGSCESTCRGGCVGGCSGACKGTCKNDCKSDCKGNCKGDCKGECTNYCKGYCQKYCEYQQIWSQNHGSNNPGGQSFSWQYYPTEHETIRIPATDWNTLSAYIEAAGPYCGRVVSLDSVSSGDPITADIWNKLNNGLSAISYAATGPKIKDESIIYAADVRALATSYNAAKISRTLPANEGDTPNLCCQQGMYDHVGHVERNKTCQLGQLGNPYKGPDYAY